MCNWPSLLGFIYIDRKWTRKWKFSLIISATQVWPVYWISKFYCQWVSISVNNSERFHTSHLLFGLCRNRSVRTHRNSAYTMHAFQGCQIPRWQKIYFSYIVFRTINSMMTRLLLRKKLEIQQSKTKTLKSIQKGNESILCSLFSTK